ncbi:hypothetical protein SFUMM280S_06685 [Streptomyces fumanus]
MRGLTGAQAENTYGIAEKLALDKKDFQGIRDSYEFDPVAEKYIKVDPMHEARWYPTLTTLSDGRVLSVSGLDDIGQLVPGKNEVYDPETKKWSSLDTVRQFPTYPALFLMQNGKVFYSGSNAGYGPHDVGRDPGVWDVATNEFTKVSGLSDPHLMETSGTVLLPPAQDEKYLVIGGGGVGESTLSSKRTRLVDLKAGEPRFTAGPSLEKGTRYPQASVLPDDTVLVSGGSEDYRGRGDSNIRQARLYDPATNGFRRVADPLVGRNYHSGSILLPDGRVMFFGSDSLFADKANTEPGKFEQRIEIYTPPYLHGGERPDLSGGPSPKVMEPACVQKRTVTAWASAAAREQPQPTRWCAATTTPGRSRCRRTADVLRVGLPVRGQGEHRAGQVRAAHRDLHAALSVRRERPDLSGGPRTIPRGRSGTFTSKAAASIEKVRLIRPSASTHVTDVDQRSVALDFEVLGDQVSVTVPGNRNLVQPGWYMMFVTDKAGVPEQSPVGPGAVGPAAARRCGAPGPVPGRTRATTGRPWGRPCTRRPTPPGA